jgi:hypothetical protein
VLYDVRDGRNFCIIVISTPQVSDRRSFLESLESDRIARRVRKHDPSRSYRERSEPAARGTLIVHHFLLFAGGVHVSASRGSPPGSSVGGGQAGMGSALNCGQGSPGTTTGTGSGGGGGAGGGAGGGGVTCVGADVSANEASDWRGAHSIAALRRRASDASQQYSPQPPPPPPPGPPQYTHDMEYSSVY